MRLASEIGTVGELKIHSYDEDGKPVINFKFTIPTKNGNKRYIYTAMGIEK